ncbi:aldo/keto reductase [Halorubrum sp. SD626R]|jgi:2,5-diketo-D-gluconate reductase B|uniref:aldo/keto reductase n=1 Tax=Halorubrum sp. SD626R TaxID=1419722 RepID=UPI000ACE39C2|nr:aldo/keto reductase [Halorubrum sp. SD626R]TKX81865.1 aldo/keto reductase [Halorubrum sp. SD626R]
MTFESLPPIGLGTWQNDDPEQCAETVATALETGYRHVDTARFYENEAAVGDGIAAADVPREEVFLASKLHPMAEGLAHDEVYDGIEESLSLLGVDALDLVYVHWPVGNYDAAETLSAFDDLVDDGLARHVGVSNFDIELLDEATDALDAPLFANQVERHPMLPRDDLVAHAREHGYYLVAYSPLARGEALDLPAVEAVAEKHGVSPAQACLAWVTHPENVVAVPKATGSAHLSDNLGAADLELDPEDVERIDDVDARKRFVDREGAPWQ